jgi:spore coat protein H
MKLKIFTTLLFCQICLLAGAQSAIFPDNGTLYDGKLHRIDLKFNPDTLAALYHIDNRWTDHSYPAQFIYDFKDTVHLAGVRIKGNSSRNSKKQSLKIDLDEFGNFSYQGLKTFNLNGDHNDPSMCREYLSTYVMNKAGNACLRSNLIKLYINGTFYGLFTNAEQVNKTFLKSRFGDNNGNLYKCSWPADLVWIDNSPNSYKKIINPSPLNERTYELKTNEKLDDYSDLVVLINTINNTPKSNFKNAIDTVFNVQSYLKILATEVLIGHWDNYFYNKNNYYLYNNPVSGKFEYLPYDMDNTFGVHWGVPDINVRNIHNWGNLSNSKSPLTNKIMEIPEFKKNYEEYVRQIIDGLFNATRLFPVVDSLRTMLNPSILMDPYYSGLWASDYGYDYDMWQASFSTKVDDHAEFGIKPFINSRVTSAQNQFLYSTAGFSQLSNSLLVYPNPVKDFLYFKTDENTGVQIVSLDGQLLLNETIEAGETQIDMRTFSSGVYAVRYFQQGQSVTKRLMKF